MDTPFVDTPFSPARVYTTTTVAPLLCRAVARLRGHRATQAMVYTISLGKQGKRVYTMGLERRVYTIEASDPEKEKRRVSTVAVYTLFRSHFSQKKKQHPDYYCGSELLSQ